MRRPIGTLVLALVAVTAAGARSEAQVPGGGMGGVRVFTGPGGPTVLTPGYAGSAASAGYGSTPATTPTIPYSYYVLPASQPSRVYVGPEVYPFYGHPYGYIYDRWTWPYMSGGSHGALARYYYPPLGF